MGIKSIGLIKLIITCFLSLAASCTFAQAELKKKVLRQVDLSERTLTKKYEIPSKEEMEDGYVAKIIHSNRDSSSNKVVISIDSEYSAGETVYHTINRKLIYVHEIERYWMIDRDDEKSYYKFVETNTYFSDQKTGIKEQRIFSTKAADFILGVQELKKLKFVDKPLSKENYDTRLGDLIREIEN
ncbi:hypothetical protein WSM22_03840 [Cytophagales bacterium WSM2-2]|nr:hypothetical protein WSM22_03840 [Cytophagales bacterium WSM2-2]